MTEVRSAGASIKHVFAEVRTVDERVNIVLHEGTKVEFPPAAWDQCRHLQVGDRMLIDMDEWGGKKECAYVYFYRDGRQITHFMVGHNGMYLFPLP
ncbi:MAG TPA: hypothetical protein VHD55_01040 [Candidatus Paceibacterota bacterium]|nr:hypothetical protein [Candidatus Paceibacterota bacterium]